MNPKLTGSERLYGWNEMTHKVVCPRDVCAVPVALIMNGSVLEVHCKKCRHYGHKDGSYIGTYTEVSKQKL
jgi:hypothetical protein